MHKLSTYIYTVKQGIVNIGKNKMFSLASVATMAACIFLFGIFYSIVSNFQSIVKDAEEKVAITVFFDEELTEDEIKEIGDRISKRSEVKKMVYISPEQAWEDYKEKYFEGNEALSAGFEEDNPLANSANYQIYLSDVSKQASLVKYIKQQDGVRQINKSDVVANTLSDFNKLLGYISAAIIIILLLVAVFLISNTIMVGINVRKDEIAIMKLIGATDFLVKEPFIIEGVLIGLVGSAIPLGILYLMYGRIIAYIMEHFIFLNNIMKFLPVNSIFKMLTPISLILGVGIGYVGSKITLRKHLKV